MKSSIESITNASQRKEDAATGRMTMPVRRNRRYHFVNDPDTYAVADTKTIDQNGRWVRVFVSRSEALTRMMVDIIDADPTILNRMPKVTTHSAAILSTPPHKLRR